MAEQQQQVRYPRVIWEGSDGSTKVRVVQVGSARAVAERVETDALGGLRWVSAEGDRYFASGISSTLVKAVVELHGLVETMCAAAKQDHAALDNAHAEIARLKNEPRPDQPVVGPLVHALERPRIGGETVTVQRPIPPDPIYIGVGDASGGGT
jgi:hypothetical protein